MHSDRVYEEQFLDFSRVVERWIAVIVGLLAALLLIIQLLLLIPQLRYQLVRVEQLEGVPFYSEFTTTELMQTNS